MKRFHFRPLAALLLALSLTLVSAHAELAEVTPAQDAVVTAPETVTLVFTEATVTGFSLFKVYPLPAVKDLPEGADPVLARNAVAGELVSEVLQKRDDAEERADTGLLTTEAESAEVVMALKDDLVAGDYVIMWRVLSVDTHTTSGYSIFTVTAD